MEKEKLCPYTKECDFYQGKIEGHEKPHFFLLNIFCRGGSRGWTDCKRYKSYEKGNNPEINLLPNKNIASEINLKTINHDPQE